MKQPTDFMCDSCGAAPGEQCVIMSGKRKGEVQQRAHSPRHSLAYQAAFEENEKEARERERNEEISFNISLAEKIEDGNDLFQWLKAWLRLEVESKITCPEEGMPDDVEVVLYLGKDEISRARL